MKNQFHLSLETNAIKTDGEDTIKFTKPVVITDDSEQRNGTRYDIPSMEMEWNGKLTANHSSRIEEIIGKVTGLTKGRKKITIDGIKFAVQQSALARFARDMMLGGFATDLSIETYGPFPDDDGVYKNSRLVGCSLVVTGNNKSATLNELALNSIQESEKLGLDTNLIKQLYLSQDLNLSQKTMSDEVKGEPNPETEVAPAAPAAPVAPAVDTAAMEASINKLLSPVVEKLNKMEQSIFDNKVEEPKFKKANAVTVENELSGMDYKERHGKQINFAWDMLKNNDHEAAAKLKEINKFHLEKLQEAKIVSNSMTLGSFGNFVISPELLSEIQGFRSNYSSILSRFPFQETLSLQMAWLNRSGDINMQEVEMCDDEADGNLKPISEYEADIRTSNLHELAAVTPVCNAATRFLAADLLGDVATGYRTDYDRKRAQLIIARLEQAIEANGNSLIYNTTSDVNALKSWIGVLSELAEETPNGVLIMNYKSYWQLVNRMIGSGISGDIKNVFTTGDVNPILGINTIVVPNDLLPTLNTAETKSFVVEGVTVTVNHAVFYVDPSNFKGRTSGGLSYDLSTDAAYEVDESVRSAFQRNELVLRGSFFRGGAILNQELVSALGAAGVS